MVVILAGGGDENSSKKVDSFFLSLVKGEKQVLYLPIAMSQKEHSYTDCLLWISSVFKGYDFRITMWVEIKNKSWKEINSFDAISN